MLTRQQVLNAVASGTRESKALDRRDFSRLLQFYPGSDFSVFGFKLRQDRLNPEPIAWTEESIRNQLAEDVAFGFEKALGQRGISAGLMALVVEMWMWVLEDPLQHQLEALYPQYGLPYFKAVAVKYGLSNPIGDDRGDEPKYSSDADGEVCP